MQIVIPMTGYGTRFVNAGYKELKPFIKVEGKPIIQWIVEGIYPGEKDFVFVCRQEHLDTIKGAREFLLSLSPKARVVGIENWIKKGPVYDVLRAYSYIDELDPVIINYCDFYMSWDWPSFKSQLKRRSPDGCIPCYTGFHPHLLKSKNIYASALTDSSDNLIEIREKYSFEPDKTKAKHSAGVYYFKSRSCLKKYCQRLVDSDDQINGEYYASMPYNYMVQDGLKVWVPTNIKYFCQWGTPEDMEEYLYWINIIRNIKDGNTNTHGRSRI